MNEEEQCHSKADAIDGLNTDAFTGSIAALVDGPLRNPFHGSRLDNDAENKSDDEQYGVRESNSANAHQGNFLRRHVVIVCIMLIGRCAWPVDCDFLVFDGRHSLFALA